ncbi:MAG: hypothetical protein M5U30_08735 [Burkholderiaceae bacterium]|nr:hypothetical protein [Burkholderiaceae bacterium]
MSTRVAENLREAHRIAVDRRGSPRQAKLEPQPAGLRRAVEAVGGRGEDVGEVDRAALEPQFSAGDARGVEQVVDQPRHVRDLPLDDVAQVLQHCPVGTRVFQKRGDHADRRERVAQFVRHDGQHIAVRASGRRAAAREAPLAARRSGARPHRSFALARACSVAGSAALAAFDPDYGIHRIHEHLPSSG